MSGKPLPIDWVELEMALTWRTDDGGYYLDLTTGQVVAFTGLDDDVAAGEIDAGLSEGRLVPIEPLPSSVQYQWMSEFAASVAKPSLRRLLDEALAGKGAFQRFKQAISHHPADRNRWFAFRGERLREAAREWLEENRIQAIRRDTAFGPESGGVRAMTRRQQTGADEKPEASGTDTGLDPGILQEVVKRVVAIAHPDRIILFGSAARGEMEPDSDIDLLVIKSGVPRRRRLEQDIYMGLGGVGVAVDVIVATPEDVEYLKDRVGSVIGPALRDGREVYAASVIEGGGESPG